MCHVWDRLINSGGERMKEAGAAEPVRIVGMKGKSHSSRVFSWCLVRLPGCMSLRRHSMHEADGSVWPPVVL